MKNQVLKFSVVMSTYNGSNFLDEQIASIMEQTLLPFQLIISDDCSTDDTWEKLLLWKEAHPEIVEIYKQEQNIGYNKNFAFGLSKVKGDYIVLSDHDDIWYPNKLEVMAQYIENFPECDVFHHGEEAIGAPPPEENAISGEYWLPYDGGGGVGIGFVFNRLTGHRMAFSARLLDDILPLPDGVFYDWWIYVVAASKGCNTKYIDAKLMKYRWHSDSSYFSNVPKRLANRTQQIRDALNAFSTIAVMNETDRNNLASLKKLYAKHTPQKVDFNLFLFFLKRRNFLYRDFCTRSQGIGRQFFLVRLCRAYAKW